VSCCGDGAAGFDKGRWPVRLLADRAGFWPAPVSPMWAIARVPLSNPAAALELSKVDRGPKFSAFRASRPALARPPPSASGSGGLGVASAARAAPWAALKTVQKVLTPRGGKADGGGLVLPVELRDQRERVR
jgi:hypothetical protein